MSKLTRQLREYVAGCFTAIWIESHEPTEAIAEIQVLCRDQSWHLARWSLDRGLQIGSGDTTASETGDPLAAINTVAAMGNPNQTTILVLENFHRFLSSAEIVQTLSTRIHEGKQSRVFYLILSPVVELPVELEKLFVVVEHELPGRDQLLEIARGIGSLPGELPDGPALDTLLDAAGGLTRYEAESAYSLSLVRHGTIRPDVIWELKSGMLKKSGLLSLYRGGADFDSLGGLMALKSFCRQALGGKGRSATVKPRGTLLLSPSGCGKSQFCKALGAETGRPVVVLNVGALMGSLVGQTEQRTRQALHIIDATSPAICFLDEVDKALAGIAGSGQSDGGVSARMFGSLLTWLNDRESDVFVVCTANDVSRLPPEFARAERFDGVFFLDLPKRDEKDAIWGIYREHYAIDVQQARPDDTDWTGAEIKSCCRLSVLLGTTLAESSRNIVPVAVTSAESISKLRRWASGRCLDASAGGIYAGSKSSRSRRSVLPGVPNPSNN